MVGVESGGCREWWVRRVVGTEIGGILQVVCTESVEY